MASGPQEAPNNLLSNSYLNILDLLGEGPVGGFVVQSGLYGSDPLVSTFYDNVPVRNLDGSYNFDVSGQGFAVSYTLGTTGQLAMPGFAQVENIVPLSSDTQVTYPPTGAGNQKNVTVVFNTSMYPDASSVRVTMRIPAMYTVDGNGNTNGFNVSYAINVSLNNGPYQQLDAITIQGKCTNPYLHSTTYVLPKTTPSSAFYQWTLSITKTDLDVLSTTTQNSLYVDSIGIISASSLNYPNSVLVGTFIDAQQFGQVPTRSYLMNGLLVSVPVGYTPTSYSHNVAFTRSVFFNASNQNINIDPFIDPNGTGLAGIAVGMPVYGPGLAAGTAVTYVHNSPTPGYYFSINQPTLVAESGIAVSFQTNGFTPITPASYPSIWYGNFQSGVWTDNPAWIFYDILTNSRYGLGDFIQTQFVDKWTMYQIAQYCDQLVDNGQGNSGVEPRFSCNINIQQPEDAYNVLMNLASVFRGMIYYANGTIYTTQQDNKSPVYGYTNANVIKGQFGYADSARNTRSTVAQVRWNDPTNLYRQNTAYVEDTDGILRYGYILKEMAAIGCTSPGQAYRLGQWALLAERTLTETIQFQVGLEGLYVKPGDVFNVYDNFRNNLNQGGRLTGFDSTRSIMYLDRPVLIGSGLSYTFSAIVPALTLDGTGNVTGSDQISLIRNSQLQSSFVTNGFTNAPTTTITLASPLPTGLFVGSPWILSVTGGGNIFNNASIYQCLATTEVQPGIIEVVGLQYNTGLLTLVEQSYNIVPTPPNSGDFSPISAPSGLHISAVTGMFQNSVFYYYLNLSWSPSTSSNFAFYNVSGQQFGGGWFNLANPTQTGCIFNTEATGAQNFLVAAVSKGGVYSPFISGSFTIGANNPLGATPPLSGIVISAGYDDTYLSPGGYFTGYLGTTPTFTWTIPQDTRGNQIVNYGYNSGFLVSIQSYDGQTTYYGPKLLAVNQTSWTIPAGTLYSVSGGLRGFNMVVQTIDYFGAVVNGASLSVNCPYPRPPQGSGFVGFNGGLIYSITPNVLDVATSKVSGIYLWSSATTGFVPLDTGAGNWTYTQPGLSAFALNGITSTYNTWFAMGDTFGVLGTPIYGPVPLTPNDIISGFLITLNQDISGAQNSISGAFSQLTGLITAASIVASGNNALTVSTINGISGQLTGIPGVIQTALQVQMNTIVVGASGTLVTEINAIQASLVTSGSALGAEIGTVSTALVNSSGALSNQINIVQANLITTGATITARQVTDETALVNSGAALTTQINQVMASVVFGSGYTTSQINTVEQAVASTGGALALWIQNLSATTTGLTATVNIVAEAFVTGGSNGIGGVAVSTYGFQLNAGNQVVSMQAIAASAGSVPPGLGTIVFGGANLESSNYVAGSAGWFVGFNGFAEFGQGVFRGDFTGSNGAVQFNAAGGLFKFQGGGTTSHSAITIPTTVANSVVMEIQGSTNIHIQMGDYFVGSNWTPLIQLSDDVGNASNYGPSGLAVSNIQMDQAVFSRKFAPLPGLIWWTHSGNCLCTSIGVNNFQFSFDITSGHFNAAPSFGVCNVEGWAGQNAMIARYLPSASSSTVAVVTLMTVNGNSIGVGTGANIGLMLGA